MLTEGRRSDWYTISSPRCMYFLSDDLFFTLTNSVDTDEMPHYVAFHLGLHCL